MDLWSALRIIVLMSWGKADSASDSIAMYVRNWCPSLTFEKGSGASQVLTQGWLVPLALFLWLLSPLAILLAHSPRHTRPFALCLISPPNQSSRCFCGINPHCIPYYSCPVLIRLRAIVIPPLCRASNHSASNSSSVSHWWTWLGARVSGTQTITQIPFLILSAPAWFTPSYLPTRWPLLSVNTGPRLLECAWGLYYVFFGVSGPTNTLGPTIVAVRCCCHG